MERPFLSVIIPSYNEMANLQKGVLDKVAHFLSKQNYSFEVIIVDDGSDDGSADFAEKFIKDNPRFKLIKNNHLGKAGAVTKGVFKASGKIIVFTDMDQATPIEELNKILPYFDKGFDIVIGSRNSKRKGAPWTRLVMARGMMILRSLIVGISGISDTQCGFKAFRREVANKLFNKINKINNGFHQISGSKVSAGFDVELLFLAQKMKFKIKEVPVDWLYVETRRVSPLKDSVDGLLDLIKIKLNSLKGIYE
ncbi:MAG: glycosyltransferase [Candidatus Pacearchaeota archaeon]